MRDLVLLVFVHLGIATGVNGEIWEEWAWGLTSCLDTQILDPNLLILAGGSGTKGTWLFTKIWWPSRWYYLALGVVRWRTEGKRLGFSHRCGLGR